MSCKDGSERLYDLSTDPLGSNNIVRTAAPDLVAEMRRRLKERYPDYGTAVAGP